MPKKQQVVKAAENRLKALQLAKNYASYRAIAKELKVAPSTVHRYIQQGLAELNKEFLLETEEYRRLELERLDTAVLRIWEKVLAGDIKAFHAYLKAIETKAKLMGLNKESPRMTEIDAIKTLVESNWITEDKLIAIADKLEESKAEFQKILSTDSSEKVNSNGKSRKSN